MKYEVSIIIPVYNGEKFVKQAIQSALDQTYKNIEVIVINDGSVDNTDMICKSFGDKISYYKKINGGVATALNLGISKMKGKYFSWLSHDDLYCKNKIEIQINYIKENNIKDSILFGDYELINESGKHIMNVIFNEQIIKEKPEYILLRGFINGVTMLIPKKAFETVGLFDETKRCTQDYNLWKIMKKEYKFFHIPKILAKTRVHSEQDTNSNPNVINEGNPLWISMIEDVPDKRKIELEGSIYNYYFEMSKFLSNTVYNKAMKFCVDKCDSIDNYKNNKKNIIKKSSYISRFFKFYRNNGIISGTKILINRLFKRKG